MKHTTSDVIVYQSKSGALNLRLDEKKKTLWATQAQMAAVFGVNSKLLPSILRISIEKVNYLSGELVPKWNKFKSRVIAR